MKKLTLLLILLFSYSTPGFAFTWQDLWWSPDEQAFHAFKAHQLKQAGLLFENKAWSGTAFYRAGDYQNAASRFQGENSALSLYNLGNSLAHLGQYEEAIQAYEEALKLAPTDEDAKANRDLLKKLLQNQQKNNNQESQNKTSNQENKQNNSKQSKNEKDSGSQNQQQSKSEKDENKQAKNNKGEADNSKNEPEKKNSQNESKQPKPADLDEKQREKMQANQQFLQRIPDDPGGLLRRKFLRDYQRLLRNGGEDDEI